MVHRIVVSNGREDRVTGDVLCLFLWIVPPINIIHIACHRSQCMHECICLASPQMTG